MPDKVAQPQQHVAIVEHPEGPTRDGVQLRAGWLHPGKTIPATPSELRWGEQGGFLVACEPDAAPGAASPVSPAKVTRKKRAAKGRRPAETADFLE